jgi:hypothetical protein
MTGHHPNFSLQLGLLALDHTATRHAAEIRRLIPLAKKLAWAAGSEGITVADLRETAVQAGVLTGRESGRTLSYLGAVCSAAGLVRTGEYRRSHIPQSHGNLGACWSLPR